MGAAQPAQCRPACFRGPLVAALAVAVAACATPSQHYQSRATSLGFAMVSLEGEGFPHLAYAAGLQRRFDLLRVYIEHDGTPWIARSQVARDPTPRTPFALELMAQDSGPRLLLGRPCYFDANGEPGCNSLLWTHRRYSAEVVTSMSAALRNFLSSHPYPRVALVGYSGGGTIAWLMAARIPETVAVITVAANLDVDDWARIHDFTQLEGSLNPASLPALPPTIEQRHYVGGRDRNVPPSVLRSFAVRHPEARIIEIAEFDHTCCWIERWTEILRESAIALSARDPATRAESAPVAFRGPSIWAVPPTR
jgi:alpha/beta hydrolase fold